MRSSPPCAPSPNAAFCHAARAAYGGLVVDVAASRLDAFSEAVAAAFDAGRYVEGLRGSHTIAPFIAEKYRTAYEHLQKGRLAAGAKPICTAPSPSERTYRMGWFARPCVLHDPTHRITLDPDRPNGPLVLGAQRVERGHSTPFLGVGRPRRFRPVLASIRARRRRSRSAPQRPPARAGRFPLRPAERHAASRSSILVPHQPSSRLRQ